jgi:hypothetical protein
MSKKITNLAVVANQPENPDENHKITRDEIALRVRSIRQELEKVKAEFEGGIFDAMTTGEPPRSLSCWEIREPDQLANYLNPVLKAQHDRGVDVHYEAIIAGYQIGMLAGVIFGDCPASTIDRFERGLVFATAAKGTKTETE